MEFVIDALQAGDWPLVAEIYHQGIATRNATFETTTPTWEHFDASHRPDCRLVARNGAQVLGWAVLSPVSKRAVYSGVAENSIYVAEAARGQGIGKALLRALIDASEQAGIWMLQTGIFPENIPSIKLHQACGFRIVGTRERIGRLHGIWRDVVLLERRSTVVGT